VGEIQFRTSPRTGRTEFLIGDEWYDIPRAENAILSLSKQYEDAKARLLRAEWALEVADRVLRDMDSALLRAKDALNAGDMVALDTALGDGWIAQNALVHRDAARKRPPALAGASQDMKVPGAPNEPRGSMTVPEPEGGDPPAGVPEPGTTGTIHQEKGGGA
jgi:hypothetical protein